MKHLEELEKARKSVVTAEHMLTQTFHSLKEIKILLAVLFHLHDAYFAALESALTYERSKNRITPYHKSFMMMLNEFRIKCAKRYKVDVELLTTVENIEQLYALHKKSPMEFKKGDQLVLCDDEYALKVLSPEGLRQQITDAKLFIEKVASVVTHAA